MKFAYIDESGDRSEGDVFVMAGILLDAYRLRKTTADFDAVLRALFRRHPGSPRELKTKAFMRGNGGWSTIPGAERQAFLSDVCHLAVDKGNKVIAYGLSFASFDARSEVTEWQRPWGRSYWVCAGLYLACLVQKKMQVCGGHKGLTALVMDDNKVEMPALSEQLYRSPEWFDGLYQIRERYRGEMRWTPRTPENRFDQIINTGFSVRSEHSSLVQVCDVIAWVYRRSIEAENGEDWIGEASFYRGLKDLLDANRLRMGGCPPCEAPAFYEAIRHPRWTE